MEIAFLTPYITALNSLDDATHRAQLDLLKRAVKVAAELGAPGLRVYGGKEVPETERQPHFDRLVAGLRIGGEAARQPGIKLAVENHQTTMTVSAKATMEVVRAVNLPNAGVLYDEANLSHMHQEDFAEALDLQRGYIVHVHVKGSVKKPGRERSGDGVAYMPAEGRSIITRVVGGASCPGPGSSRSSRAPDTTDGCRCSWKSAGTRTSCPRRKKPSGEAPPSPGGC
ncbi:MAG: sugar phosphate isomerase/epimerase family protein [candidate division NC10 bacterium]